MFGSKRSEGRGLMPARPASTCLTFATFCISGQRKPGQTPRYSNWSTVDLPKILPHVRLDCPHVPPAGRWAARTPHFIPHAALFQALPFWLTYISFWMGRRARSLTFSIILFSTVAIFFGTGICFPSLSSPFQICMMSVPTTRVSQSSHLHQAAVYGNQ